MKLKLSHQEGIQLLAVTESLLPQEISILRAGILKILHSDAPGLILDLSHARVDSNFISQVRAETQSLPTPLIIVSTQEGVGDVPTVQEGLARLNSPLKRLLTRESQVNQQITASEATKKELEFKLNSQNKDWTEFLKLKHRFSTLKKEYAFIDKLLQSLLGAGKIDPSATRPPVPRTALLSQVLKPILLKQELLKEAK